MCDLKLDGQILRSAEHAYQWLKCTELNEPRLAERIFNVPTAREAKNLVNEIDQQTFKQWLPHSINAMKTVLMAKFNSNPELHSLIHVMQ